MSPTSRPCPAGALSGRWSPAPPLLQCLRESFATGSLRGHAYLLVSPGPGAARYLGLLAARMIHCRGENAPCDSCDACQHAAPSSLEEIRPLGAEIRIKQVHALLGDSRISSWDGGARVFLVAGAENFTMEAANAFLKLLEEPPEGVVFLLATARQERVLGTIRSRCRSVHPQWPSSLELLETPLAASPYPAGLLAMALEVSGRAPALLERGLDPPVEDIRAALGDPEADLRVSSKWVAPLAERAEAGQLSLALEEWLSDPSLLATILHGLLCSLDSVLGGASTSEVLEHALGAHRWVTEVEQATAEGLERYQAEIRRSCGDGYVHPLLSEGPIIHSHKRVVSRESTGVFLRALSVVARIGLLPRSRRGRVLSERALADLRSHYPSWRRVERAGPLWAHRILGIVETAWSRLYASGHVRGILEDLFLQLAGLSPSEPSGDHPGSGHVLPRSDSSPLPSAPIPASPRDHDDRRRGFR